MGDLVTSNFAFHETSFVCKFIAFGAYVGTFGVMISTSLLNLLIIEALYNKSLYFVKYYIVQSVFLVIAIVFGILAVIDQDIEVIKNSCWFNENNTTIGKILV